MPSYKSLLQAFHAISHRHGQRQRKNVLAIAFLPLLLGGCVFLTPPTGVCLGSACRELDTQRAQAAQASQPAPPKEHEAPDFKLTYPGEWGLLSGPAPGAQGTEKLEPVLDQTDPSGVSTLRIAVGRAIPLDGGGAVSEGLRIITINQGMSDTPEAGVALAILTRRSLAQNFSGEPEVFESEAPLGGKPAYQVVMVGVGTLGGPAMRYIARAGTHRSRGYIVMLTVPDVLYTGGKITYDRILDGFEWRDGDPTYPLPTAPANPLEPVTPTPPASPSTASDIDNSKPASPALSP